MKIFVMADLHFNHKKLSKSQYRPPDFDDKIKKGLEEIPPTGVLILLGDICIGKDEEVHSYIKSLPFKKILVKGNHDSKSYKWYMEHGWDFVCETFTWKAYGKKILFSHKPQEDNGYDINIHGHFHNSDHRRHEPELVVIKNNKQILIAIELTNYKPVPLETLIRKLEKVHFGKTIIEKVKNNV